MQCINALMESKENTTTKFNLYVLIWLQVYIIVDALKRSSHDVQLIEEPNGLATRTHSHLKYMMHYEL